MFCVRVVSNDEFARRRRDGGVGVVSLNSDIVFDGLFEVWY